MGNSATAAILDTIEELKKHKTNAALLPKVVTKASEPTPASGLIAPIIEIRRLLDAHPKPIIQPTQGHQHLLSAIKNCSLQVVQNANEISPPSVTGPSIFRSLRRAFDENLHSDCLASLLDPTVSGKVAEALFTSLASHAGANVAEHSLRPIFSRREMRLDKIDVNHIDSEIGDRRIDLLIESKTLVLIIENKVLSTESIN